MMLSGLEKKEININFYVKELYKEPFMISQYLDGLISKNETYRYNCFKVLYNISENKPDMLYPHWDFFTNNLKSKNDYHKIKKFFRHKSKKMPYRRAVLLWYFWSTFGAPHPCEATTSKLPPESGRLFTIRSVF